MKKRKGAALATAILLSGIFVLVTLGVTSIVVNNSYRNKYINTLFELDLSYRCTHERFISYVLNNDKKSTSAEGINGDADFTDINASMFTLKCYCKSDDVYTKAIVIRDNSNSIRFYSITKFNELDDTFDVCAYQTTNQLINGTVLAGIVDMGE